VRCAWLLAVLLAGGCGSSTGSSALPSSRPAPSAAASPAPGWTLPVPLLPVPSLPVPSTAAPPAQAGPVSRGWEITVYYTGVEQFHHEPAVTVTGCPKLACRDGSADLGSYPKDFVRAVRDEGTGRTAAGTYLNWSYDTGYWLDTTTRDSYGNPLVPFVSAAADPGVLKRGTRFTVVSCGRSDDDSAPPAAVCEALRSASWLVTDEFTPGLGGSKHIDAYLGPETGPGFTDSPWYLTLTGATLQPG
jgi:hypothetical protein